MNVTRLFQFRIRLYLNVMICNDQMDDLGGP